MPRKIPQPIERRIITPMRNDLVAQIDEYRWQQRIPSRSEAIRQLIGIGLQTRKQPPKA